ncbi:MAG TPA: ABC transporter permease [Myxococcales bacterium]|jgi:predicted permease
MLRDLRTALRVFRHSPGFAAVVVLTIGIAVGATTSVFSVVRGLLLRPLPYREANQLVRIFDASKQGDTGTSSLAEYRQDFESLKTATAAAWAYGSGNLSGTGAPEHVLIGRASSSLLPVLGVAPAHGRWFTPDEEEAGKGRVIVLGRALWQRRFGGDPAAVGATVSVSGTPLRIVGVLASDLELPEQFEAWTPLAFPPGALTPQARGNRFIRAVARIRRGKTLADLRAELSLVSGRLLETYPDVYPKDSGFSYRPVPLLDQLVGGVRQTVWMLFFAVLLVLLMACANVGNLLLARAAARQRELAVRAALGAGRAALVRQVLAESLLLALAGGALGVLVAVWGVNLLLAAGGAGLPRADAVRIDGLVLAFAAAVSIASGLLFGILPAIGATDLDLEQALRASSTAAAPRAGKLRRALVMADVALAVMLVSAAALLLRSFSRVVAVDPGFRADGAVALDLSIPGGEQRQRALFHAALQRLRELPSAVTAGGIDYAPLTGIANDTSFEIEGRPVPPDTFPPDEEIRVVTPGFFEAMGMHLLRGRTLQEADPSQSLVVNESFAKRYFGSADAVGKRLRFSSREPFWTVAGVVADAHDFGLDQPVRPTFYVPFDQFPTNTLTLVLRSNAPPREALRDAVQAIATIDPALPAYRTQPIASALATSLAQRAFSLKVLDGFALLALLLASLGLYGVLAYSVAQRTREVGVRMALGARPAQAILLIARESAGMVGLGLVAGCAGAVASARLFAGLLYGVGATDPASLAAAVGALALVAAAATLLPARRAARVDPAVALRAE